MFVFESILFSDIWVINSDKCIQIIIFIIFSILGIAWVQHPGYAPMQTGPTPMVHTPLGPPPTPFMHIPYSEPAMMIPMGGTVDLMQQMHQNVTQITQHSLPIMATQAYIPARSQTHYYNNSGPSTSNNSNRTSYNRYSNNSSSSASDGNLRRPGTSSNPQWREREVSKIPPRFQKQRYYLIVWFFKLRI